MAWSVEFTDEFGIWFRGLDDQAQRAIAAAIEKLQENGPALGRPFVDTLTGSRLANMKELRPMHGHVRILFAFDPRRTAILLLGGDKSGQWQAWYRDAIPAAERLYEIYLAELRQEGLLP
jgi:hypothetical protein